jgi:hypothetical protein
MLKQGTHRYRTALRSPHDDQEAEALLLGAYCPDHLLSAIVSRPTKQRNNMVDCTMGSGDRVI